MNVWPHPIENKKLYLVYICWLNLNVFEEQYHNDGKLSNIRKIQKQVPFKVDDLWYGVPLVVFWASLKKKNPARKLLNI